MGNAIKNTHTKHTIYQYQIVLTACVIFEIDIIDEYARSGERDSNSNNQQLPHVDIKPVQGSNPNSVKQCVCLQFILNTD